ncbi:MAG: hypothetical protein L6R38_009063 [Xanthoria sp. 2 TBL-2021]|nr:MAG: hypothetical protein L6R38_009063 [Xanthoria sp. 2 TBL-2021]
MAFNGTIALVSGAYHIASSLSLLSAELFQLGFPTRLAGLVTPNHPNPSVKDDITALIDDLLNPLINVQGQDVVLYLHSYSGFPASAAIGGFSKRQRKAEGLEGGIVELICQSAFVPTEGRRYGARDAGWGTGALVES